QSLSLYAFLVIRALSSFPTRRSSDLRIRLVVGILDNRPVEKMGTILASILGAKLHRVYVTTVPDAKTAPSARLVRCFQGLGVSRSEEHTSELQSRENLVCRLLLEKKK